MENRVRNTLVVLLGILFISLVTSYLAGAYHGVVREYQRKVYRIKYNIEAEFRSTIQVLQVMAVDGHIETLDPEIALPEMVKVTQLMGYVNIGLFDPNGKAIVTSDANHPDHITDETTFLRAMSGVPTISDRILRRGMDKIFVSVRVPVYEKGLFRPKAILTAGVSNKELARIIHNEMLPTSYEVFVLDSSGQLVYHPRLEEIVAREAEITDFCREFYTKPEGMLLRRCLIDGVDKIYVFTNLEYLNWRLVMAVPLMNVAAAFISETADTVIAFSLTLVFAGLLFRGLRLTSRHRKELELERLERLSATNQMAAAIAHEIRNPLTSIKGFVQLIMRRSGEAPPANYLEIVSGEIERIEQLTNEFRLLAKPVSQTAAGDVDLARDIQDVITLMESQALSKNVSLSLAATQRCVVTGNSNQLKQVWINLIRNAIEAVQPGGQVTVALSCDLDKATVEVRDNGPGITQDALLKLGKPFFTTKEAGTGLGLAVCFNIIRTHGGRIEVNSNPGEGASFLVYLPLDPVSTATVVGTD